jgi:hypothetical protein
MKKRLLVLTGCNGDVDIINFAKNKGIEVFATDFNKVSVAKDLADFRFNVSTTDIPKLINIVDTYKINGITTGTSESSMCSILTLSELRDIPFYTSRKQLEIINDKKKFKDHLIAYGVPVTPEYHNVQKVQFPAIVKPVDSSGSKGISICENKTELEHAIKFALQYSRTGKYIIEKCVSEYPEVFFNYTIVDGEFSLSCAFDNYKNRAINGFAGDAIFNIYPSKRLNLFKANAENNLLEALRAIGLRNGVISIQTFFDGNQFMVYEAGYRLGGTQSYIFTDYINNVNHMHMMVHFALYGKMLNSKSDLEKDNAYFKQPCCQKNISIGSGVIREIVGLDEIQKIAGVLNITQNAKKGDKVYLEPFKRKLSHRIHITANTHSEINEINEIINSLLRVIDTSGNDMILEKNKYIISQ